MAGPNVLFRAAYYTKESKEYQFYSSQNSKIDYLNYVSEGHRQGKYKDYVDYTGNTEKSYGAFGRNGILTDQERKEIRKGLRETDAQIWSCLLSFEEEYGKEHMKSYLDAKQIIEKEFPKFIQDNRMNYDNIVWFAGLHENTDNRHIHICFYEKEPLRLNPSNTQKPVRYHSGTLTKSSMDDLKVRVEKRMSSIEYNISSERNKVLGETDEFLDKLVDPYIDFDKGLKEKLLNLYKKLPYGNYGYQNHIVDGVREEIDDITTYYLVNEPGAKNSYFHIINNLSKYDKKMNDICESQHIDSSKYLICDKFKKDIYRRVGNQIINYVNRARKESINSKYVDSTKTKRWNEKKRIGYLLNNIRKLDLQISKDRNETFDEFERLMAQAEYERISREAEN